MSAAYDVFLSHAWADGDRPGRIADALGQAGLRVWFDAHEINDFSSITRAVNEGLSRSKVLLAHYSKTYPLRRACQWELIAAFLASQSEGDANRRLLVVNPEKSAEHIHPVELRDAKFLDSPVDNESLLHLVQAIASRIAEFPGPLADIRPLAAPTWYGTIPVGSTRFAGRISEMWRVHSLLHQGEFAQVTGATAATGGIGLISGLGGAGKSLLAEEYALRFGAAYPGGIFWLRAYGNEDAKASLSADALEAERSSQIQAFAERRGISVQGLSLAEVEGALAREIEQRNKACLWIVDDIPSGLDGNALRRWFGPHSVARTLITTRSREYGSLAKGIDLFELNPVEASGLLTSRLKPVDRDEEEHANLLAAELGYHALALDVTASALMFSVADRPYSDFRSRVQEEDEDALELAAHLSDALPNGHEKSIAATILHSVRRLEEEGRDFLRLASIMATAPIPASLVVAAFGEIDDMPSRKAEERTSMAFRQLASTGLAEPAEDHRNARTVHALVSRTVRFAEKASSSRIQALSAAAISVLSAEIARAAPNLTLHKQVELQISHARQMASAPITLASAALLTYLALYDMERGSYASARALNERLLSFAIRELGPEHELTVSSMNHLGIILSRQGNPAGACKLHEEVLAIRRRVLGPEHPDTLNSMNHLAESLHQDLDLVGARRLHEEVLAIRRRVLGPEHPDTLNSMNNLAETLRMQRDLAGARKLQEDTLEIRHRVLGPEHSSTLQSMNILALILMDQGDLAGTRGLQEEALKVISKRGQEHPETLASMNNLAETLRMQGDLAGARSLHEQVLSTSQRVLGHEHPSTLFSMNNLGETLRMQGDLASARSLHEETLAIRCKVLGQLHPNTMTSIENLAETLGMQGDMAGARKLREEAVAMMLKEVGLR